MDRLFILIQWKLQLEGDRRVGMQFYDIQIPMLPLPKLHVVKDFRLYPDPLGRKNSRSGCQPFCGGDERNPATPGRLGAFSHCSEVYLPIFGRCNDLLENRVMAGMADAESSVQEYE